MCKVVVQTWIIWNIDRELRNRVPFHNFDAVTESTQCVFIERGGDKIKKTFGEGTVCKTTERMNPECVPFDAGFG